MLIPFCFERCFCVSFNLALRAAYGLVEQSPIENLKVFMILTAPTSIAANVYKGFTGSTSKTTGIHAGPKASEPSLISLRFGYGFDDPSRAEGFVKPEMELFGDAGLLGDLVNEFEWHGQLR